jgi:hypothetical protein
MDGLPADILLKICGNLDNQTYIYFAQTNKKYRECLQKGGYYQSEPKNISGLLQERINDEMVNWQNVKFNGCAINSIKNPSERVQRAAVSTYGDSIRYIVVKGIIPSEQVQLIAVSNHSMALLHICCVTTPSEDVQIASVMNDPDSIRFIIQKGMTPSEKVQLAAFSYDWSGTDPTFSKTLKYVISMGTPSEKIQLAAVTNNARCIRFLLKANIIPSEQVQIAAVSNDCTGGEKPTLALQYILRAGIIPSDDVQFAAVSTIGKSIKYLYQMCITPSERMIMAALNHDEPYSVNY